MKAFLALVQTSECLWESQLQILGLVLTDTFFLSAWQQSRKSKTYSSCLGFTGSSVAVSFTSHKQWKALFAKRVRCLGTFLGDVTCSCIGVHVPKFPRTNTFGNIELVYWGPEDVPGLPGESHRQVFLENRRRESMWQVSHFWRDCAPSFIRAETPALSLAAIIYYIPDLPLFWGFNINFDAGGVLRRFRRKRQPPGSADLLSHPSSSKEAMLQPRIDTGHPHSLKKSRWSKWQRQHKYGFL